MIKDDPMKSITKKVGKIVKNLYNQGVIDVKLRKYMMPTNTQPGVVKANPKAHKKGMSMRTIISTKQHRTTTKFEEVAFTLGK